jgi:acyl dehydratase
MIDPRALGVEGKPFVLDVERGKVREFARAVRATHPAYFEGEHPIAPPTFLTTTFFWERDVEGANPWHAVQMDQQRGMHAEQEYVFHGEPPRAGTRLHCRSRISEIYEKQGKRGGTLRFAVMLTEFRDGAGTLVAEARMTGVETDRPPQPVTPTAGVARQGDARPAGSVATIEDGALVIGPLTRTDFVRYQGASGDLNPVHHDEEFARAAGYPAPLGVGMFQAGVLAAWAAAARGPERVRGVRVRWREPVWPGDVLVFRTGETRERDDGGARRLEVALSCTRQGGGVAVDGSAWFAAP